MKENYNNKTKLRSAWFALVLLMITALPITAQNAGEKFQVGQLYYEVVDATNHTETSAKPYPFSIILVFEHYWLTCSLYF